MYDTVVPSEHDRSAYRGIVVSVHIPVRLLLAENFKTLTLNIPAKHARPNSFLCIS